MELQDKVAVITGGASGMGKATARRFVKYGAKCALFDINEDRGKALADELGASAIFCRVDIADEKSVSAGIARTLETFGAIHINANYAGTGNAFRTVGRDGPFPLKDFKFIIEVNLIGTFNVLRLCAQEMAKNVPVNKDGARGVIINTASVAAYEGQIGQAAYSASKGGIVGMTVPIARDLASLGIRVNTIVPGLFATPMFMAGHDEQTDEIRAYMEQGPLKHTLFPRRLGEPDEIAKLAQALVENDYINSECIRIDSGMRMTPKF